MPPPVSEVSSSADPPAPEQPLSETYAQIEASEEFRSPRSRLHRFVFTAMAFFLLWYATYVVLGTYARGFMATPVAGPVNIGLLFGLGQFVTTFAIAALYVRFANHTIDPLVERIRLRWGLR